jgi:hypothetical protein
MQTKTDSQNGPLDSKLRKQLERMVLEARKVATDAAREKLESLTVHEGKRGGHITSDEDIELRNRLRAHARFLGDRQNSQSGAQKIDRLVEECAYQHWHRMLFARFLVENELLIQPDSGQAVSMEEVEELAHEDGIDAWELAGQYTQAQLPAIFPVDNPVMQLKLASDSMLKLTELLEEPASDTAKLGLPQTVFMASDSLGWVYQFWQDEENTKANKSGDKIDSTTLPAVTQFFTEDYMVSFLIDNTLGAWHAGKVLSEQPSLADTAESEDELRRAVRLESAGGYDFEYLRFVREPSSSQPQGDSSDSKNSDSDSEQVENDGPWRPMGGTFDGWPVAAAELKVLDPCCGSGHFLVAALELLVRLRMSEEGLGLREAIDAVLVDNLFGLELDKRCTQIAVFNLALAAWKLDGSNYRKLPSMAIAHVGQSVTVKRDQWMKVLDDEADGNTKFFFGQLYDMFSQASTLGSLINPRRFLGSHQLDEAGMDNVIELLESAVAADPNTEAESHELQLAAKGLATATKLLSDQYDLVLTNVPYLGRGKQDKILHAHIDTYYKLGKADLSTACVLRCLEFCKDDCVASIISPQNWWFLSSYSSLRKSLLENQDLQFGSTLGEEAWRSFGDRGPVTTLSAIRKSEPSKRSSMFSVNALPLPTIEEKDDELRNGSVRVTLQEDLLQNPDHRITVHDPVKGTLLSEYADSLQGVSPADFPHYGRNFWEVCLADPWQLWQSAVESTKPFGGRSRVIWWNEDFLHAVDSGVAYVRGRSAWKKLGVAIRQMRDLPATIYTGEVFDTNTAILVPKTPQYLSAIWAFAESGELAAAVRKIDKKKNVTNGSFVKIGFDLSKWEKRAAAQFPNGLPSPESDDPTQWLFHGWPSESSQPLHVAVARLLGYRWPAELDSEMRLSDRARDLVARCSELDSFTDEDGIVCIPSLRGEDTAADRLGPLLSACGVSTDEDLDDWFRNRFFKEHCELFDQRPFIWHIWDGRKRDGFHALVNYHKLAGPGGHKVLERLTYSYLGDWIERQEDEVNREISGAELRLQAANELKQRLEAILAGEPPYDIFVRWKPIYKQAIGWNPDINDGVRINLRPLMQNTIDGGLKGSGILRVKPKKTGWGADKGKEPKRPFEEYPWFWSWDEQTEDFTGGDKFDGLRWNDLHYTNEFKQKAREEVGD